jgi:hypothetical protein
MASSTGTAGAGLRMVTAPPPRAISSARRLAGRGGSNWVTNTEAPPMIPAAASMSSAVMVVAAPGQTMIALSPVASSM